MAKVPHFLIVGAQKGGTTAAIRNLSLHPEISSFCGVTEYGQHEIEFFNQHWDRGVAWYASHFLSSRKLIGEKTAELLHRTVCHERIYSVNSKMKLVVLLRSPVDRAYSQWKMAALDKRDEPESFDDAVQRELLQLDEQSAREAFYNCAISGRSPWREGYIRKGMYAEQLESLFRTFPRNQVHITISERLRRFPVAEMSKIFTFLEVNPINAVFGEHFSSPKTAPMGKRVRSMLEEIYSLSNQRLFNLLGHELEEWKPK